MRDHPVTFSLACIAGLDCGLSMAHFPGAASRLEMWFWLVVLAAMAGGVAVSILGWIASFHERRRVRRILREGK